MILDAEEQLGAIAALLEVDYVQLGFYENGAESRVNKFIDPCTEGGSDASRHPALCSVKLFTATLTALLAQTLRVGATRTLAEVLPSLATILPASATSIHIGHLLAHTHGLADTLLYPEISRSRIPSLFSPGRFYSYGSTGYLLLGRIIEALSGQRYEKVLYDLLLERLACEQTKRAFLNAALRDGRRRVCPAAGSGLSLSLEDLLAFTRLFADGDFRRVGLSSSWIEDMLQPKAPMPGWSPYIKASCYGFRDFGRGWFGHNGLDQRCLTYLRVNPARRAAICLLAKGKKDNLGMLPAMLLKDSLPELVGTSSPPPKIDVDKALTDAHPLFGCYSDALYRYEVLTDQGRLKLKISESRKDADTEGLHECFLYPAENEVYFLSKPWMKLLSIQLIVDSDGRHYLWSLDQMIPRLERLS